MNEKQLKSERIYSENSSFSSMGPGREKNWGLIQIRFLIEVVSLLILFILPGIFCCVFFFNSSSQSSFFRFPCPSFSFFSEFHYIFWRFILFYIWIMDQFSQIRAVFSSMASISAGIADTFFNSLGFYFFFWARVVMRTVFGKMSFFVTCVANTFFLVCWDTYLPSVLLHRNWSIHYLW